MNRQILREQAREETKMQKWFNSFTPQQARFHKELVRKIVQDSQEKTEMILDSCYIGAILQHTEMELSECIKIAKLANVNMEQTSKYLSEEREYYNMINDEKLRGKIREEAKELQRQGMKIAAGIKELRKVYNFPQKDIHIIWAEGREELKAEKEVAEKLHENMKKVFPKEEIPYTVTENEIETSQKLNFEQAIAITNEKGFEITDKKASVKLISPKDLSEEIDRSGFEFKEPSKLKIIEQTIKGECDIYVKSSEGVKTANHMFKNISELEEYKSYIESDYTKSEKEINKQIEELKEKLNKKSSEKYEQYLRIAEITEIFNM